MLPCLWEDQMLCDDSKGARRCWSLRCPAHHGNMSLGLLLSTISLFSHGLMASHLLYAHLCLAQAVRPPRQLLLAAMLPKLET